ncbi:hypothetical protein BT63DRAFT_408837 [Microthyrium microscopicum]|uniref:Uncharacterized protein n=1 Tax=Microthyrium microscopicum TaxID=703497 RepID=A0A6A6UQY5_9PEZI|nr:hypothetical protein BT63DRAFT_408837 [Microthyrium microscopicum]
MLSLSTYLAILGSVSHVLGQQGAAPSGPPPLPADAQSLPADCKAILSHAGTKSSGEEHFVSFKLSATAADVSSVLGLPALSGVKAIQSYTQDFDRGFTAKLTYQQICAVDKDPKVAIVLACDAQLCAPAKTPDKPVPGPGSAGIKGAPDTTGLNAQCAKVVWYTVTEYDPATIDPGKYVAETKIWVLQKEADAFFLGLPGIIRNQAAEADGFYAGKWTNQQLCDIEKSGLVSRVETMELPGAAPNTPKAKGGSKF